MEKLVKCRRLPIHQLGILEEASWNRNVQSRQPLFVRFQLRLPSSCYLISTIEISVIERSIGKLMNKCSGSSTVSCERKHGKNGKIPNPSDEQSQAPSYKEFIWRKAPRSSGILKVPLTTTKERKRRCFGHLVAHLGKTLEKNAVQERDRWRPPRRWMGVAWELTTMKAREATRIPENKVAEDREWLGCRGHQST